MTASSILPEISIVIPFFNEAEVAFAVVDELCVYLAGGGRAWEVILVDDGSIDGTSSQLERARERWPLCRIIRLSSRSGQCLALLRGIEESKAPIIATMDGDGQNVPRDFDNLFPILDRADLVVGRRMDRHDTWLRRAMSRLANKIRARALGDHLTDAGCALKLFRREVAKSFVPVYILHPYMPALAAHAGFRIAEAPVQHRPRTAGRSKYGIGPMFFRPLIHMLKVWWIIR